MSCLILECEKPPFCRGWCASHYHRWQRYGDPLGGTQYRVRNGAECSVEGCDKKPVARNLCGTHWSRWRNNGDPEITRRRLNGEGSVTNYGYLTKQRRGHPLAGRQGAVLEHRAVLYDAIGPGTHLCHHCMKLVAWEDGTLCVDHLDWDKLNNARWNLAPSCLPCNSIRHQPAA